MDFFQKKFFFFFFFEKRYLNEFSYIFSLLLKSIELFQKSKLIRMTSNGILVDLRFQPAPHRRHRPIIADKLDILPLRLFAFAFAFGFGFRGGQKQAEVGHAAHGEPRRQVVHPRVALGEDEAWV